MEVGKKLKELRTNKKLSQKKLSQILECSQSVICDYENLKVEPTETVIKKIAQYFEVSSDYLIGLEDDLGNKIYNDFRYNQGTINNKF